MFVKLSPEEGRRFVGELWQVLVLLMGYLLCLPVGQHVAQAKERGKEGHKADDFDTNDHKPTKIKVNLVRQTEDVGLTVLLKFDILEIFLV